MEREYQPGASSYAADHVARYEASGGEDGGTMSGVPIVVLHTIGRRTGHLRKAPLIKVTDGRDYVVVASKGGAPSHPDWYLNLEARPDVTVQDGDSVLAGTARTVKGTERERLWARAVSVWPDYEEYQGGTDREIPVVVIEVN